MISAFYFARSFLLELCLLEILCKTTWLSPGGEGYSHIWKLYRYVPHFRVWFSSCFSLK